MKKGYMIALVAALVTAVAAIIVLCCILAAKDDVRAEGGDNGRSELLTEALLYADWQSDDYLIFEDGTVVSRKTFEKVYKLDLSHIAYTDGALCMSGSFVAFHADEKTIKVYDLSKGKEVASLDIERSWDNPAEMALSPCGRYLLYGLQDDIAGIFDLSTGEKVREVEAYLIQYFEFSQVGRYFYQVDYNDAHSGTVQVVSMEDPSEDVMMYFYGRLCPIDNGGNFLVDIDNDRVLDMSEGRWVEMEIDGYFEFSQSGRYLAVETPSGVVRVYDTKSWEVLAEESYICHSGTIFIDDDRYMLTCHYPDKEFEGPQTAELYDTETWTVVNSFRTDSWVEDLRNLSSTYIYDMAECNLVDALTSETICIPYYFDYVKMLDVDGPTLAMILESYQNYELVTKLIVFDKYTGEYYVNVCLPVGSDVFVSDDHDYLVCNAAGAYRFTLEDLKQISRILCE